MTDEARTAAAVIAEVKKAVVGKDDILAKVLLAILARGHILLEDIPGVTGVVVPVDGGFNAYSGV